MTVPAQASQLLQSVQRPLQRMVGTGAFGQNGEVMIPDMDEPVKVDDVVRRLIEMSDKNIEITHKELRVGDKLYEQLFVKVGDQTVTSSGGGMLLSDDDCLDGHGGNIPARRVSRPRAMSTSRSATTIAFSRILAALGRAEFVRLNEIVKRRRGGREGYRVLSDQPGIGIPGGAAIFGDASDEGDSCWLTAIVVDPEGSPWTATQLGVALEQLDIERRPLRKALHLQPVSQNMSGVIDGASARSFDKEPTLRTGSSLADGLVFRVEVVIRDVVAA